MFVRKKVISVLVGLSAICLSACSDNPDSDPNPAADETSMPSEGSEVDVNSNSNAPAGLAGTWLLVCSPDDPELPDSGFSVVTLVIQDDLIVSTTDSYSDINCTESAPPTPLRQDLSIVYTGFTETALGEASNVDLTVESASVGDVQLPAFEGQINLDIFLVNGDSLYTGIPIESDDDGSESPPEEIRPTELEQVQVFSRQ